MKIRYSALVLIIAILVSTTVGGSATRAQSNDFAASLVPVSGLVQYLPNGTDKWLNVVEITLIKQGDQIRTADNGIANLYVVARNVSVTINPTSQLELNRLGLDENTGALQFTLFQLVGLINVSVGQKLAATDSVQVISPLINTSLRGTQFILQVTPDFHAVLIAIRGTVDATTLNGAFFHVGAGQILQLDVNLPQFLPASLTALFAHTNTQVMLLTGLPKNDAEKAAIRTLLQDILRSNAYPDLRNFLRTLVGLPTLDFAQVTLSQDKAALQELRDSIGKVDTSNIDVQVVANEYMAEMQTVGSSIGSQGFAPATCGNNQIDPQETMKNCSSDFQDTNATSGDNICQIEATGRGESLVNDPVDCLPFPVLGRTGMVTLDGTLNVPAGATPGVDASGVGGALPQK